MEFFSFKEKTPEPGRTFLAVWATEQVEEGCAGFKENAHWAYAALYSFAREPFGLKLFRGDCRSEEEAARHEAEQIADGKWVYVSDAIAVLANKEYPIQVEGGIDETNPWIGKLSSPETAL